MRAIQIAEPNRLCEVAIEAPGAPRPGEAIVRTHQMGVCGTDISSYLGKFPFFDYPRIPGHELGVEVVDIGEGVTNVKPGDRCSVEPYMNCGTCYACRRGNTNCCANLDVIGVMVDGGLCEQFAVRADKLHPSTSLTYEQLALVETLAIGCHGTERGEAREGDHVLVIGAGPIGLATIEFTRLTGAQITVMDIVPSRLEFVRNTYGIENTITFHGDGAEVDQMKQITDGDLYAVVTDATGNPNSMVGAIEFLAPTGTLVFLGITTTPLAISQPPLHRREGTIKSSRNALPRDFTRIIDLIEQGEVNTNPWITHRTTFDGAIEEFETFTQPESGVIKAMIAVA